MPNDDPIFQRYAIFHLPDGPLSVFGADWLGWDILRGEPRTHPDWFGFSVEEITDRPRKYGLHATIKAPFRMANGRTTSELIGHLKQLASELGPVTVPGLSLTRMGRILSLVARGDQAALKSLAGQVVQGIDGFRAPLTDVERARRLRAKLSPIQKRYLDQWGYPHVMEQFNFHITLTNPLKPERIDHVEKELSPILCHLLPEPYQVNSLSLVRENRDGFFEEIERVHL